jgi:hypothetical protein
MIIDNASNQQYSLVSSENKAEANVNLSCFITFIVKKSHILKKMGGGWANSSGGWAEPNHALPWLRH